MLHSQQSYRIQQKAPVNGASLHRPVTAAYGPVEIDPSRHTPAKDTETNPEIQVLLFVSATTGIRPETGTSRTQLRYSRDRLSPLPPGVNPLRSFSFGDSWFQATDAEMDLDKPQEGASVCLPAGGSRKGLECL